MKSEELVALIHKGFQQKKWTLSAAESCTGGLLSAWITERAGISQIFLGSIIAYSNQVKADLLGVSEKTLNGFGAVSIETAKEMARGACKVLKTDWALSVTGIAGPGGGTANKPVGTVCFAVVGPGVEYTETQVFSGDRRMIQEESARHALELLCKHAGMGFDLK